MKVFITGGFGFVGRTLTQCLVQQGYSVTLLDRSIHQQRSLSVNVNRISGDATQPGEWQDVLAEHDVIINLAGETIFKRWNNQYKDRIYNSRILCTRHVVDAMRKRPDQKKLLINASAIGYYGLYTDQYSDIDEFYPQGNDFLAQVAFDWEKEAVNASALKDTRVVLLRFAVILGKHGGALKQMLTPFRYGLGCELGSGKQYFSWIHELDLANIVLFVIRNANITGAINCCSPSIVTQSQFAKTLATVVHRPIILPAIPGFMLKLVLGEFGNSLLHGVRAVPTQLLSHGFQFQYPEVQNALANLVS
ncbi:MAG: TIGR01777 family protein [Desulfobacterales bacterium]|nr:TIGR01777 family protein [Desulfobacterales bacterium]